MVVLLILLVLTVVLTVMMLVRIEYEYINLLRIVDGDYGLELKRKTI